MPAPAAPSTKVVSRVTFARVSGVSDPVKTRPAMRPAMRPAVVPPATSQLCSPLVTKERIARRARGVKTWWNPSRVIKVFPLLAPYNNCSPYGPRGNGFHYGVDLCAAKDTPVVACDDGHVTFGQDPMGGNVVVIHATDGNAYYGAHLDRFEGVARAVRAGEIVGYVDMTGNAVNTVEHLHFEWWPSGSFQRPAPDPTAQLLAAPILSAPVGAPIASTSWSARIALAAFGAAALLGLGWGIGYALEHRHA